MMNQNLTRFEQNGFTIYRNVIDEKLIFELKEELSGLDFSSAVSRRNGRIFGVRNLLNFSKKVKDFSKSETVRQIIEPILGSEAKVVRGIFFDKNSEANWKVPWHQDLTIAVKEKCETEGFSAWTQKAGIQHVQPPTEILKKMATLRFHLDDADEMNGALKVIPASHNKGRLSAKEIISICKANEIVVCRVKKGDCLIMRPLLVHSSSAGLKPRNRRVIHLEFSADELQNNLKWYGS